jgi:uncharacterized repeat protein (TIGR03833 family)
MPRNSASGANKQRRRPQPESSSTRRQFKPQLAHSDPNRRLDGQTIEQSFTHRDRTREPAPVVGLPGWKAKETTPERAVRTVNDDDVWRQLWGDVALPPSPPKTTRDRSANASPAISRTATPELPKNHPSIPKAAAIIPGRSVDIILKQDQGTGRTVNGIIGEILSRGDHPWGIKVRLKDGRVGRVQKVH